MTFVKEREYGNLGSWLIQYSDIFRHVYLHYTVLLIPHLIFPGSYMTLFCRHRGIVRPHYWSFTWVQSPTRWIIGKTISQIRRKDPKR